MKLTLRVDQGDGPMEVTTNLYTIVAWERRFKTKASNIANGIGLEDLAFLAHTALQQIGVVVPIVLDDFIKKVTVLEVVEDVPENPTVRATTDTL
ncbi:MAG: hypothetical protein ACRCR4_09130 [Thiotrichaceae bacterium]